VASYPPFIGEAELEVIAVKPVDAIHLRAVPRLLMVRVICLGFLVVSNLKETGLTSPNGSIIILS